MSFELFLSINPQRPVPVSRFGSGIPGQRANTLIGAERDAVNPRLIRYFPDVVVGITASEYNGHRREYNRALKCGDLVRRSKADFDQFAKDAKVAASKTGAARKAQKLRLKNAAESSTEISEAEQKPETNNSEGSKASKSPKTTKK